MLCLQKRHTNTYLHSDESSGQTVVAIFYEIMVYQHMLDIHYPQTHSDETSGRCGSITVTSLNEKETVFKNYYVRNATTITWKYTYFNDENKKEFHTLMICLDATINLISKQDFALLKGSSCTLRR